jgi:CRISPR-associated endoribonuclease Cas6
MPIAFSLRLKPARPWRPDTAQLHGLVCALFEQPTSDHNGHDKPFAAWPLAQDPTDPHTGLLLRCAWLHDQPPPSDPRTTRTLRLGNTTCTVVAVEHHRAACAELASGPPATAATMTFRSPTCFARNGEHTVDPAPRLIVGGWRRRWNQALAVGSALGIDDELWRQLHQRLRLGAYELSTAEMDSGHGFPRLGFVGVAELRLQRGAPLPVRSAFATLARFAPYCGTGAQATHGFGATTSSLGAASTSRVTVSQGESLAPAFAQQARPDA